jgi:hypothetical protein
LPELNLNPVALQSEKTIKNGACNLDGEFSIHLNYTRAKAMPLSALAGWTYQTKIKPLEAIKSGVDGKNR